MRCLSLSGSLSPGSLALGDTSCHVRRTPGSLVERPTWGGPEGFSPTASGKQRPADRRVGELAVEARAFSGCSLLSGPEPASLKDG